MMAKKFKLILEPDAYLAVFAMFLLLSARYRVRYHSIDAMRKWATTAGRGSLPRERLFLAFRRATARAGGTCLMRALALQRLLSLNGHASELRIGVDRNEAGFQAHAWLVDGDTVLVGGGKEADNFSLLATWPTDRSI